METKVEKQERLITVGAVPKKDMLEIGYEKGVHKDVRVLEMKCGRFQIFKHLNHFREKSGHKVYDSIEAMEEDFELIREINYV